MGMEISGVFLAAGMTTRIEHPKQLLLPLGYGTIIEMVSDPC